MIKRCFFSLLIGATAIICIYGVKVVNGKETYQMLLQRYKQVQTQPYVLVDITTQTLTLNKRDQVILSFSISSSKHGIGSKESSNKTPLGGHQVQSKIGDGAPIGTIFKYRKNTQKKAENVWDNKEDDLITTRIIHLKGVEEGINKGDGIDSYKRCIYIHGTAEEKRIGTPASRGCIRMKNRDIVILYRHIQKDTLVYITK